MESAWGGGGVRGRESKNILERRGMVMCVGEMAQLMEPCEGCANCKVLCKGKILYKSEVVGEN